MVNLGPIAVDIEIPVPFSTIIHHPSTYIKTLQLVRSSNHASWRRIGASTRCVDDANLCQQTRVIYKAKSNDFVVIVSSVDAVN